MSDQIETYQCGICSRRYNELTLCSCWKEPTHSYILTKGCMLVVILFLDWVFPLQMYLLSNGGFLLSIAISFGEVVDDDFVEVFEHVKIIYPPNHTTFTKGIFIFCLLNIFISGIIVALTE